MADTARYGAVQHIQYNLTYTKLEVGIREQAGNYVVHPDEPVDGRIGAHVTLQVDVAAFPDFVGRKAAAQAQARSRRI